MKEPIINAKEREDILETNVSDEDSELSETESYLTCDSGVSDDEGSSQSCSTGHCQSGSRKRTRSSSDSEFSDALDRYLFIKFQIFFIFNFFVLFLDLHRPETHQLKGQPVPP